jgi:hypothetical protein
MNKLLSTAVLLSGMALATNASAATATFTSDHCSGAGGCGGNGTAFATITGTQVNANTVDIVITPLNGNLIIGSGLTTFTFNLTTNVNVTYSNLTLANQNPGFSVVNGFGTNNLTQSAGAIGNNGFGTFEYGVDFTPNGGGNGFAGPLSFTLTGTGLTLDDFAEKSINGDVAAFFALDIYSKATGNTGLVDCCTGQPTPFDVPIPAPLALFAAGLVGISMLRRVTKKKRTQADDLALS